ncbi:hypothetical protein HK102_010979, partial [Quaeritorhiza haematococci]
LRRPAYPSVHPNHEQKRYAGHNKWSQIKRLKAANDLARANRVAKITKQIICAIKTSGAHNPTMEADPRHNPALAAALEMAKQAQIPKANVEAAIKKGMGVGTTEQLFAVTYEALVPPGVALIIECLTSNKNRTLHELRHFVVKKNGSFPANVTYLFQKRGRLIVSVSEESGKTLDVSQIADLVVESDYVEDFEQREEDEDAAKPVMEVWCAPNQLVECRADLEGKGLKVLEMESGYFPLEKVAVGGNDPEVMQEFESIVNWLENHEDVVRLYTNAE